MREGRFHLRTSVAAWLPCSLANVAMLLLPTSAAAQQVTDSAEAEARAIVLDRLTFFKVQDLSFGRIHAGPTPGVVRVHPDGTRTHTGGVVPLGNEHQPARFAGMGLYNQQVRIRMGSNTIQLTGPGAPMTVSQFEIGSIPTTFLTTTPQVFRLGSPTGMFNFPIGARVTVNANQGSGTYTGTFLIRLDYM